MASSSHPWRDITRNHDFTVLWVGTTISELGSHVSLIAFPLLAFALTGSTAWSAATEAVFLLGLVAALLPAGAIADRIDPRAMMRTSSLTGVVAYSSLAVAGALGALTIGHLLAVALVGGLCSGSFQPAESAALRKVVSTEEMPTALSQQQARQQVAGLLGGPVGGALFAASRWLPFGVDAISYLVEWVMLGRIRADLSPRSDRAPKGASLASVRRDITAGLRFTWGSPFLRVLLLFSPLMNLVLNALFFAAVLRLIQGGTPSVQIGLVEAAAGLLGVLGALAAPRFIERTPTGVLATVAGWSWVPLAVPVALWGSPWVIALALSAGMFLNPAGNAGIGSYRMTVVPADMIGRVQSAMQFVSMATMPLAPALAGLLMSLLGGSAAILVLGGLTAAVALIPTLSHSVRTVPRPAQWPAALSARPGAAA